MRYKDYDKKIEEMNDSRKKVYYNLSELVKVTGMSTRALKYRMLNVKNKYKNEPFLLTKKNGEWMIHYDIIKEFYPKYATKNRTIHTHPWISTASWNTLLNYDSQYHTLIINEIKKQLPGHYFMFAVEKDGREFYHTHLVSDAEPMDLNRAVTNTIFKYIDNRKEIKLEVEGILNKYAIVDYIRKAPIVSGIL